MEIIQPGQYAVFHKNAQTEIETDSEARYLPAGAPSTCLVFDSLDEAKNYCQSQVERFRNLRCEIYDSAGKAKPPLAIILNPALAKKLEESPASAKRKIVIGVALMALSIPLFVWDWEGQWTFILPTLAGINMLFIGFRIIIWGLGTLESARQRQ
jgi:hypothetical protein